MNSILLCVFITFGFVINLKAQTSDSIGIKRNNIYVELGGSSYFYSVNYDYVVFKSRLSKITFGGGLAYFPIFGSNFNYSLNNNFMIGKTHNLELGLGILKLIGEGYGIPCRIGYRYQPKSKGVLVRLACTPLLGDDMKHFGLSLGYTF